MIRTIRHRGLKRLVERDDPSGLNPDHLPRIMDVLANLNVAAQPQEMDIPGFRLHALKGAYKGFWSVRISANYRLTFRMENGDAFDVNLVDYH